MKHERHECPYCAAVYGCEPARKLRKMSSKCRAPYYWPCPECFLSGAWKGDERFDAHVKQHHTEGWKK